MSKALIVVESPAKARTLKKYLGKTFEVKASVGHIRDLPVKTLGVDVEHDFKPQYVTIRGKSKIISELKSAARKADEIYLAPDPDREGEAIAWHIAESLKTEKKPIRRALFYELTKKAILDAVNNASQINNNLFQAQQTRRILDRLVGYQISPLLWEKVRRGLSAGRVQSVAVRMVCEREREIKAFQPEEYWSIGVLLQGASPPSFMAQLERKSGRKKKIGDGETANAIAAELRNSVFLVSKVEKKEKKRNPSPPFITSTMQIEANRKLRFSAKKTMTLAQRLYEGIDLGARGPTGLITYMRTDSTRINNDALAALRGHIQEVYGDRFLPPKPNKYKTGKMAQDAHEAIRPTDVSLTPDRVASYLDKGMLALYTLIWKRFVASQMAPALFDQTIVLIDAGPYTLKAAGSVIRFQGFKILYTETGDEAGPAEDKDLILPNLNKDDRLQALDVQPKQHFTQPPPRFTEASLVKALEENGVGRPSTYAAILSTIQDKEYVLQEQRKFRPTDLGILVNDLLVKHFPDVIDVEFTAAMEKNLDLVEDGSVEWLEILRKFYGPFKKTLVRAREDMASIKRRSTPTDIKCGLCEGKLVIKWGRMGEFLACENYPDCKHTQNFKKGEDGEIIPVDKEEAESSNEVCEKCGRPMVYKHGRYGRFLACSGYPECRHIQPRKTGVRCPEKDCNGELVEKISRKGKVFYSCSLYPKCKFAIWDKPVNEPCPECGAEFLVEKNTKTRGNYIKCANKSCRYSRKVAGAG